MLTTFDFVVTQLRYTKAAMDEIPSFRPDGQSPAQVQALIGSAGPIRTLYITAKTTLDGARALRRTSVASLHDACVDFGQQARNTFRKDAMVMERLERLPTKDESFQETLTRADATLALWAQLPLIGTPPAAFTVAQVNATLTMAGMTSLRDAAVANDDNIPVVDQDFQLQESALHAKQREMEDMVTSALTQGRSQFPEGTLEREIIDAIPTESPRNVPDTAVIESATNPAPGEVELEYTCSGATSFDVFMRAPGETEFVLVGEDVLTRNFEITALTPSVPPDQYTFYVRGRNSRGFGGDSAPVSLDVT
ncbi:MAG: fibronectin type III domain-containing protein [Verrucomicrobiaceae bacterium]|nr:fibronectin type III domain-containing protein [Verrucomicrobiaceae bacterium]